MTEANKRQVGGEHYKTGGTEYWDLFGVEALVFYAGRYVARWRKKGGVQDLEKALHVCEKIKERGVSTGGNYCSAIGGNDLGRFTAWLHNADITWVEKAVLRSLVLARRTTDIDDAMAGINHLLSQQMQTKKEFVVLDKNGARLKAGDSCTWMQDTTGTQDVTIVGVCDGDLAQVETSRGVGGYFARGSELRLSKPSAETMKSERRVPRFVEEEQPVHLPCCVCSEPITDAENSTSDGRGSVWHDRCSKENRK